MARTSEKFDAAQAITDEIIGLLEKGTVPWRRPWKIAGGGVPLRHNGEGYRGINAFLLGLRSAMAGYSSPYWMTFNQAKALDACVKKGSKSSVVVYYGTAGKKGEGANEETGGGESDEGGGTYRFLKNYRVFNASQIEGLDDSYYPKPEGDPAARPEPIPEAQAFYEAIDIGVTFGGDQACYIPSRDHILLPELARFESASQFYSTWHHEQTHATKLAHRLDRSFGASSFGNEAYAKEELVACVSQVLMGQRMGFHADHIDNHAAYIEAWIKVLRGDKRFLFTAAAHAQRAVDWLTEASAKGTAARAIAA
ncbi:MAG: zincin-like metallopeptidase domain-containing protein [Rhodobacterales bacterium]|nr:zincin-like metallopeptidase domain-containing protein [Rhodobacterales bacterium]